MLRLEDIRVEHGNTKILRGIHLEVKPGEKLWIHGPSGSGKSTLLKVMFCAEYFNGRLLFNDQAVSPRTLPDYRSRLGYISQKIPGFSFNVEEVLRYPFMFRANRRVPFPMDRAREILTQLRFDIHIISRRFADLSGGEQQRLMIVLLLLLDRPIFLLDEVTAALDPDNIETVVDLLTKAPDKTVISVSHNSEWRRHCSRSLLLDAGDFREAD